MRSLLCFSILGLIICTFSLQIDALDLEQISDCLNQIDERIDNIAVPDQIRKLSTDIRSLNPHLGDITLTKMIDKNAEAGLNLAGLMSSDESSELVGICADYVTKVIRVISSSSCGGELAEIASPEYEKYDAIMEGHANIDQAIGHSHACLKF